VIVRRSIDSGATEVLIARRPDHVHQGGLWEFPGGKVEPGEDLISALDRELSEELGIRLLDSTSGQLPDPDAISPLIQIRHAYPDKTVFLDVCKVSSFQGEAFGREGQAVQWVPLAELDNYTFPSANRPIVSACLLPNRYFITPSYPSLLIAERELLRAQAKGAGLIYFRQPQLGQSLYESWLRELCSRHASLKPVLMSQRVPGSQDLHDLGVHLSFRAASKLKGRPVKSDTWFAVSCHNEQEIAYAQKLDADFVTLSPVLETASHPEQSGMGWAEFCRQVVNAAVPVYGLGGLSLAHETPLNLAGAQGLAGISFWQS
jgi:8-oxo-dGTP diphosphatase